MKKRIASIVCAAMLMLALPTLAWADPSPAGNTVNGANGTSITAPGATSTSDAAASNVPAGSNVLASYIVSGNGSVSMYFYVGTSYAGQQVTVYVQNPDGTQTAYTGVVAADGSVVIDGVTVNGDAIVSLVVNGQVVAATTAADKSAKSPATGVDMGVVAGGSAVALCGAAVVAVALRKKVTE